MPTIVVRETGTATAETVTAVTQTTEDAIGVTTIADAVVATAGETSKATPTEMEVCDSASSFMHDLKLTPILAWRDNNGRTWRDGQWRDANGRGYGGNSPIYDGRRDWGNNDCRRGGCEGECF
jgi:hypothetical protein